MDTENTQKMNLCLTCRRRLLTCVCQYLRPFETQSRFIILMHPMEFKKEKVGTGRFSHLILTNSEIIVDVGFDQNKRFLEILKDESFQTVVLYPGEETIDLSDTDAAEKLNTKPLQLIVIDGTWPCAKKMMKLTTRLHDLQRVSFDTLRLSEFQVKHQPLPGCLSTVESIHQVLIDLNKLGKEATHGQEENLMEVFRRTVQQQIELAQDPSRVGYRKKAFKLSSDRKISKKWGHRLLFFRKGAE